MHPLSPGNVAVITGGAGGIGLAMAEAFVDHGLRVVLADIDAPKLRATEARLGEAGAEVATMVCDTTVEAEVDALAEFAVERFGGAHIVCNNAGVGGAGDAWTSSIDLWHRVFDVNVFGVVHGIRAFLPIMEDQGVGHIVNTASAAGLTATPGIAPYGASKHAVVALSESLFVELRTLGSPVGVSVLCPMVVKTDLMDKEPPQVDGAFAQAINEVLRAGVDGGVPASDIAAQVVGAVRDRRFWILTHEESKPAMMARFQRAADGVDPPAFGAA
jgi:NAD(P)-dependent dehydrogenase (short-subunit alcohol dehydrogenase family)